MKYVGDVLVVPLQKGKGAYSMWIALLVLSWSIEMLAGGWFLYSFWTFPGWSYRSITGPGPGYSLLYTYSALSHLLHHPYPLTQVNIAQFFLVVYAVFHVLALLRGLGQPARERLKVGVRMQPGIREIERFERAFDQLVRTRLAVPDAPLLKKPRWWAVRDGRGMQIRWIGWVLVIDHGLLESKHFPALLAHELAHSNSFDLLTRTLFTIFPPLRWAIFTLLGLPNASGKILLYPLWMKYWRDRVYAADEYTARLGQRHQLIRALDELKWAFEGSTATKGGRWLRETPYIESRIDRLMRYQAPIARPALGR
jgi:Peptidase family M48